MSSCDSRQPRTRHSSRGGEQVLYAGAAIRKRWHPPLPAVRMEWGCAAEHAPHKVGHRELPHAECRRRTSQHPHATQLVGTPGNPSQHKHTLRPWRDAHGLRATRWGDSRNKATLPHNGCNYSPGVAAQPPFQMGYGRRTGIDTHHFLQFCIQSAKRHVAQQLPPPGEGR